MKKLFLFCLVTLLSLTAWAYDFEADGIYYNYLDDGASVEVTWGGSSNSAGTDSYTGDFTVPASVSYGNSTYTVTGIGDYAFRNCGITDISLPETITSMGMYAFYGCSLTTYSIPATITSIGNYAFGACKSLTTLSFPEGITSIPQYCCYNCSKLTSVTLPDGLITIEQDAFDQCSALPEITLPESLTSIGTSAFFYCSKLDNLVFPSSAPLSIGESAFNNCGLTSIYIPATVTVGMDSFSNNDDLSEITFEEGLTYLGDYCFSWCRSLESIFIPNTITYMGEGVFYGCDMLSDVQLEEGLTFIGDYVFSECYSLEEITLPEGIVSIGEGAFSECEALTTVNFPSTLTYMGDYAFNWNYFETFTIPGTLTYVGVGVLADCYNLSEVILEEGVPYISDWMFSGDEMLTSIEFPNSITSIGEYAFYGGELSGSLVIPATCKTVGDYAFYNNMNVSELTLSEGVEYIGDDAFFQIFYNTSNVVLTIPESVTYIGSEAFYHCSGLKELYILANINEIKASTFYQCTNLTTVSIPKTVKNIGNQAFYNTSTITSITSYNREAPICGTNVFSSGIMSKCTLYVPIGSEDAYKGATTWKDFTNVVGIEVEDDEEEEETKFVENGIYYQYVDKDAMTVEVTYESTVFNYYTGSITVPATVTHNDKEYTVIGVGENAFRESPSLTALTLSEGITYIDTRAFWECTGLKNISLPQGLIDIGMSVFYHCAALTEITIPATVTSIGSTAFSGCTALTAMTIPASVTYLGNSIFSGCTSMETLILADGAEPLEVYISTDSWTTSFSNSYISTLYLGRTLNYESSYAYLSPFRNVSTLKYVTFGTQEITLGAYLFYYTTGIEDIYIPENVTISDYAFYRCESLTTATIGAATIGTQAFNSCTGLKEVTLLETITSIDYEAFFYCDALEEVTVACNPSGCYEAFYHCTALKKVILTENVNRVRDSMFYNGVYIEEIYSFNPTPPSLVENSFRNVDTETCVVYVPVGSYDAYATAEIWEEFLNIREMTTLSVETLAATDITDTTATLCGTLIEAYDDTATEKGFEYWCDADSKSIVAGDVDGNNMTAALSDLSYGTTYTYRAYAINTSGTVYGDEYTFTTDIYAPTVLTGVATDITATTAVVNGEIELGSEPINSKGFIYWDKTTPNKMTTIIVDDEDNEMSYTLTSLTPATTYTYRAFAITDSGTTYGEDVEFTTLEDTATGIDAIGAYGIDGENVEGYYTPDGRKLNAPQKGITIVRYNDGSVRKIYTK